MKKFVFLLMIVFCLYEQVYAVDVSTNNAVGSPKGSLTSLISGWSGVFGNDRCS